TEQPEQVGIYSLILNHSEFGNRIGLRMKKGEGYVDTGQKIVANFDEPISMTLDGVNITVKVDVEHLEKLGPDADRIILSTSGAPFINLSPNSFVDNLQDFNAVEQQISDLDDQVFDLESEVIGVNRELTGLDSANILKNPRE